MKRFFSTIKELGNFGPLLAFAVIAPGIGAFILATTSGSWYEPLNSADLKLYYFFISAVLLTGLSLVPTHAVSLVAGMLFGVYLGPTYAVCAILAASLLSFFICIKIMGDHAVSSIEHKPQAKAVYQALLKNNGFRTVFIIFLVRLSPVMPFAGTNVLLAASKVKISEFFLGSLIGLAPRIIIVAVAGAGLTKLDLSQNKHQSLLILGIVATILAISVVGYYSKRVLKKLANSTCEEPV